MSFLSQTLTSARGTCEYSHGPQSLRDWYEKYRALDKKSEYEGWNPLEDVDDNDIDEKGIERCICDYAHKVKVV